MTYLLYIIYVHIIYNVYHCQDKEGHVAADFDYKPPEKTIAPASVEGSIVPPQSDKEL